MVELGDVISAMALAYDNENRTEGALSITFANEFEDVIIKIPVKITIIPKIKCKDCNDIIYEHSSRSWNGILLCSKCLTKRVEEHKKILDD